MPTRDEILKALEAVIDPELRASIVELDMVRSIDIREDGAVDVKVSLTTPGCPIRNHFQTGVRDAVAGAGRRHPRSTSPSTSSTTSRSRRCSASSAAAACPSGALAGVENVICVGSGKGGVGKSTLTVNLAAALAAEGKSVGVLDADVWGYSIPRMFGLGNDRPPVSPERKIIPLEAHGIKVMSIGFFVQEDSAVVWRGPMLHKALTQFLEDVGVGPARLPARRPAAGHRRRLDDARPAAAAARSSSSSRRRSRPRRRSRAAPPRWPTRSASRSRGVVENMSGFTTPGGERFQIFGEGGGQELADELDVPLLGKVPLTMPLREQADAGVPLVAIDPDDPAAQGVRQAARGLIAMAPPPALPLLARQPGRRPAARGGPPDVGRHRCRWPARRRRRA